MKKKKTFDCVAMKHQIQQRQRDRLKGLSPSEESRLMKTEILKDPALARLWETATRTISVQKTARQGKFRAALEEANRRYGRALKKLAE